jgi:hypothetical protein
MQLWLTVASRHDDGRWFVVEHFGRSYWLFVPELHESRQLLGMGGWKTLVDGGFEILAGETFDADWARFQGSLWFVPWDGERQRLASRASRQYSRLGDGRIVTIVDVAEEFLDELVVVDPPSAEERLVDHRVVASTPSTDPDDVILYGVSDGDRTGVWLTALAPRARR